MCWWHSPRQQPTTTKVANIVLPRRMKTSVRVIRCSHPTGSGSMEPSTLHLPPNLPHYHSQLPDIPLTRLKTDQGAGRREGLLNIQTGASVPYGKTRSPPSSNGPSLCSRIVPPVVKNEGRCLHLCGKEENMICMAKSSKVLPMPSMRIGGLKQR